MVSSQTSHLDQEQLVQELKEIVKIRNATSFCNRKKVHEPSWNERVHSRMLQQAIEGLAGLEYHNITTARVLRGLVPENIYGETLKKKMVDYAITLGDPFITEADISGRLGSCYGRLRRTINPSDYSPLCYDPIAVSIETKSPDGSEQDAKVQLSVWVSAHFNRLRDLLPTTLARAPVSITLPLLFVSGESWNLLFASDGGESIVSNRSCRAPHQLITLPRRLSEAFSLAVQQVSLDAIRFLLLYAASADGRRRSSKNGYTRIFSSKNEGNARTVSTIGGAY